MVHLNAGQSEAARRIACGAIVAVLMAFFAKDASALDYTPYSPGQQGIGAQGDSHPAWAPPPSTEPWDEVKLYPFVTRFSGGYDGGQNVGVDTGFTTLEWFMPLSGDLENEMFFGDARFLIRDDATVGANVGVGYRWFMPEWNRILGANFYYDYRQTEENDFNQGGIGVESLGRWIDLRANVYMPAMQNRKPRASFFEGHRLYIISDYAMTGADYEVGVSLPYWRGIQGRGFLGGYYFEGPENVDAIGWRARGEVTFGECVALDLSVQDDDLFGQTAMVGLSFRYLETLHPPFPQARKPMEQMFFRVADNPSVVHRLGDPVERMQNIAMTTALDLATDRDGNVLNFLHVSAGNPGVGTIEDPYPTLTAALADPDAGDSIIYTPFGGDYTEDITLVPGAQVLSNGPYQSVVTQLGRVQLPFSGASQNLSNLPTLTGNVVMADDTLFSGFDVTGQISGAGLSNVTVERSLVSNPAGDAIVFSGTEELLLDQLTVSSSGGRGIQLNDVDASLTSITVEAATDDGLEINNLGTDRSITLTDFTVESADGMALDVNVSGAGDLDFTLAGTTSLTSNDTALDITKSAGGDTTLILNNITASSQTGAGMNIDGSAGAGVVRITQFANNTVTDAGAGGVLINRVTFDSDPGTNGIQAVNATSLTIGDPSDTTRVTGDGLSLINPTGSLTIEDLFIANDSGTGLLVDTKGLGTTFGLVTGRDSTINTTNGAALFLDPLSVTMAFSEVTSTNAPGSAVFLDEVRGQIAIAQMQIIDSANTAIVVQNTPAALVLNFGDTTIDSLTGPTQADNVDLTTNNGNNVTLVFSRLRIIFP